MGDKTEVGLPENLEFYDDGSSIEIIYGSFGIQTALLAGFAILMIGVFFSGNSCPLLKESPEQTFLSYVFLALGIGMAYSAIAGFLNKTHIRVSDRKISIRSEPLPWARNIDMYSGEMKQLYTKVIGGGKDAGIRASYEVHAVMTSGRSIKLVSGLVSGEQALYIEQEIEKYLSMGDVPVKGEFHGLEG